MFSRIESHPMLIYIETRADVYYRNLITEGSIVLEFNE